MLDNLLQYNDFIEILVDNYEELLEEEICLLLGKTNNKNLFNRELPEKLIDYVGRFRYVTGSICSKDETLSICSKMKNI